MDAKAKNKALFRAKLNAQKKEKRINSPLVRSVPQIHSILICFWNPFAIHPYFSVLYDIVFLMDTVFC